MFSFQCTEGNQSDKVKLMMALKVMTEVAQSINETKRRKEMGKCCFYYEPSFDLCESNCEI